MQKNTHFWLMSAIAGCTLGLCVNTYADRLTLTDNSSINAINVSCNGVAGVPITNKFPVSLRYRELHMMFGSYNLDCKFSDASNGMPLGQAKFVLAQDLKTAEITSYDLFKDNFDVIMPPLNTYYPDIAVTFTGG